MISSSVAAGRLGFKLGFDVLWAPSDAVDQSNPSGNGILDPRNTISRDGLPSGFFIADSYWFIENEKTFGSFQLGFTDTASDKIDNINLASSDTLADSDVINWNGKFFLRTANGSLLTLRWDDFIDGAFMGGTIPEVLYTSPVMHGFEFSAAWGDADYWDVALRYNADWGNHLRVAAGIGYFRNTTEDEGDVIPKQDTGLGGSIALLHIPTGLNIAINHAVVNHTDDCNVAGADAAGPGAVSGKCRGPDRFTYIKGGLIRKILDYGPTAFYGEYYWTKKEQNESDPDVLAELDSTSTGSAQELKNSTARMWGFGVIQKFDDVEPVEKKSKKAKNGGGENGGGNGGAAEKKKRSKKDETPLEIYIGYRHYEVDYNLIGDAGPVAGKKIKDFDAVMTGVTIRF